MMTFDEWRDQYDTLSFDEHQRINADWASQYPDQRSFDPESVAAFLAERQPGSVAELGGWDGALANDMLHRFPDVLTWVNYDITPNVPQACGHPAYETVVLDDWPWLRDCRADALVASHVLEHMRADQIRRLLERWAVDSVYVDVPVPPDKPRWYGYGGSHILEIGSDHLVGLIEECGYELAHSHGAFVGWFDRVPA